MFSVKTDINFPVTVTYGDFGPVTLSQPKLPHRVVVMVKIGGRRSMRYVCCLELLIQIINVGYN